MAKREKEIEDMLDKLREMHKRTEKAIEKADRSYQKELKAFKTK